MRTRYSPHVVGLLTAVGCGGMPCPTGTASRIVNIQGGSAQVCTAFPSPSDAPVSISPRSEAPGARGHLVPEPPVAAEQSWEGPAHIYAEDGTLLATGRYVPAGKGALPSGRWTFFHPDGSPQSTGDYLNGVPRGCFASWDEAGQKRTLRYDETTGRFEDESCKAPMVSEAKEHRPEPPPDPKLDMQLSSIALSSGFGVRSEFLVAAPELSTNLELSLHTRLDRLRLGGVAAYLQSEDGDHRGLMIASSIGLRVWQGYERISVQIGGLLGYRQYDLLLRPPEPGSSAKPIPLDQWNFFGAAELSAVTALWTGLSLVIGLRGEVGIPSTTIDPSDTICVDSSTSDCNFLAEKHVRIGTPELGLSLGLRYEF